MYDERTIEVYKKLLEYTANYCGHNYKYYSKGNIDYEITVSYKGNPLITLQHSTNMKRKVDNIAFSIARVISANFEECNHYHKRLFNDTDYMLFLDDTGGYSIEVTKKWNKE